MRIGVMLHLSLLTLYIVSFHVVFSNSKTSTLWKLNADNGKIVEASPFQRSVSLSQYELSDYQAFDIITSTVGHSWSKYNIERQHCTDCPQDTERRITRAEEEAEELDCGKPVNFTYYDNLAGVANRNIHTTPSPLGGGEDVTELEKRLRRAVKRGPRSVQLYGQIGNFWRLKGDAKRSIECFRRALAVAPHNADVLLGLARVLLALQYLDDAMYLTRRSLEAQPTERSAWQQHYTLGEILRAYGHAREAGLHLRHALELRPGYAPAVAALRELEAVPEAAVHAYTLLIIVCLVLGVLLVILSSVDATGPGMPQNSSIHSRHHFRRSSRKAP